MKSFKALLIAAVAVCAVAGQAQGFRMMGAGGGGGMMLLFKMNMEGAEIREDVAKELKLTDDQKKKLLGVQDEQRQKMMDMFQGGGFDPSDREKLQKVIGDMMKESEKKVNEVLDDPQEKRLKELSIQRQGNSAITNPEVQKELGLTDAQKSKITALQTKQAEASQATMEKMRNGEIDRDQIQDIMAKNRKIMNDELGKILTTDQANKLKTMGGAAFKFEDN